MVWPSRHLGDVHRILRVGEIKLGIELGFEPGLDDVGPLFDQRLRHHHEAAVELVDGGAGRDLAGELSWMRRDAVGSQITAASSFLARKPLVITSMLWLRYSDGLMFDALEYGLRETVGAASLRHRDRLAVEPLERFLGRFELRRIGAHEEDIALVVAEAEHRNDADVANIGMAGGHDGRHVADVTDIDLAGEHAVDDDRALQADLES